MSRLRSINWKKLIASTLVAAVVCAISVALLYISWRYAGPIATIVYAFLFVFGLFGVPSLIFLFGPALPNAISSPLGKLHFVFGQFAFGVGYLVQRDDGYEMCPGTKERVYVDGQYHEIDGGRDNLSVLGWRPFGMLRYKEDRTLREERADPAGTSRADGGALERGGYREAPPDASVSGLDGEWLIDLKRVFSGGVKKMGDIDVIEKAEEITMRKEAKSSRVAGYEPIIGSVVGIIIGIMTGVVMVG